MNENDDPSRNAPRHRSGDNIMMRHILLQYTVLALLLLLIALFWYASSVLLVFFTGVLVAVLLSTAANLLTKWSKLPRSVSLAVVLVLGIVLIVAGGWLLAPRVSAQANQLMTTLSEAVDMVRNTVRQWLPPEVVETLPGVSAEPEEDEGTPGLGLLMERAGNVFAGVFGVVANFVIVVFLSIYLAAQPQAYVERLVILFPKHRRPRVQEVLHQTGDTLGRWLLGKLLTMLIVGVLTAVGLLMLDVPLALVLGLVAGLFEFIPYLGPILAGVPAVLIGFSQSPTMALYVLLLFLAIQAIESYLLQPLIALKTVSLPPAATISAQVLLAVPFGLFGVALATPLAATVAVLVSMLYVQDVLDDPVKPPGVK